MIDEFQRFAYPSGLFQAAIEHISHKTFKCPFCYDKQWLYIFLNDEETAVRCYCFDNRTIDELCEKIKQDVQSQGNLKRLADLNKMKKYNTFQDVTGWDRQQFKEFTDNLHNIYVYEDDKRVKKYPWGWEDYHRWHKWVKLGWIK